ncbi:MAG TPA: diphthamide biosynthesis enzyme Dph2 [Candidatus Dormibacteraeota bacterium]|jgi:2-(3-amino-3-carboxypropyl)histidine synthase|nr:diphthamide biosynthesis enzyme Dph2 [Candidatus Dormibacteraeota bacterium]
MYDLEEDRLVAEITGRGARRLLVQLPDGLKNEGPRLASLIREKTGAEVFVSATPAWGACDLSLDAAARLKADLLVHYGHNEFLRDGSNGIPVVYVPAKSRHEIIPVVEKALPLLQGTRIGLATVVQHLHTLPETTRFLESKGFKVHLPGRGPWAHDTGQVLGCDYFGLKRIEPEVDSFLVIGSYFHGLGASLSVERPTILADPYDQTARSLEQDRARVIRQRYAMVEKARQAHNFGIIVSTKPGQSNPTIALNIQRQLEENGKKAVVLYADEVVPAKLLDFTDVDAFVDTACPRLALDDPERFSKPIVTRDEIMVVMGTWTWDQLLERGLVRL